MADLCFILEDPYAASLKQKKKRSRPFTACEYWNYQPTQISITSSNIVRTLPWIYEPRKLQYKSSSRRRCINGRKNVVEYMQHGADLFFDNLGPQFPFLRRRKSSKVWLTKHYRQDWQIALFSPPDRSANSGFQLAEPFIDMAKDLTISVACQPSFETLHSLLLLAWCEYGRGHEAGGAQYAVQMALDVGLGQDANVETIDTEQEQSDLRATWWSVTTIDIISSWETGTQALLNLQQQDTQPPTASYSLNHIHTLPFDWLRDLLGLRDRLLVVLNSSNYTPDPFTLDAELM
ncbi:hypothetical protein BD410DRAFT_809867 [Rickenella mellea]|uniref:Xylanolytic transcriptional activator regulatory domain-containing protein n=1 Tax=Rickenella mellea TaxID=50990 RepID=A0A4Y7PFR0_9AGAM|nr:hypothetical protein BD410DRAFT_809867 [Rickenella mellea]